MFYDCCRNVVNILRMYQCVCRVMNRSLKSDTRRETQLKLHKDMAIPKITGGGG